jgi:hypothetical protein
MRLIAGSGALRGPSREEIVKPYLPYRRRKYGMIEAFGGTRLFNSPSSEGDRAAIRISSTPPDRIFPDRSNEVEWRTRKSLPGQCVFCIFTVLSLSSTKTSEGLF